MWTKYNPEEFLAVQATAQADSVFVSTTINFHIKSGSTSALTPPASTAGVHLVYMAMDESQNTLRTIWSKSS